MATAKDTTPNFKFILPRFNQQTWQDDFYKNMRAIDAIITRFFNIANYVGVWQNSTQYSVGERVLDTSTVQIFEVLVGHTTDPEPTTFSEFRQNNPTFYKVFTQEVQFRGEWQSNTEYAAGDFVTYTAASQSEDEFSVAATSHTSTNSYTTDRDNGLWNVLLRATDLSDPSVKLDADRVDYTPQGSSSSIELDQVLDAQRFDTYADMRAVSVADAKTLQVLQCRGRSTVTDGRGGTFVVVENIDKDLTTELADDEDTPGEGDGFTYVALTDDKDGSEVVLVRRTTDSIAYKPGFTGAKPLNLRDELDRRGLTPEQFGYDPNNSVSVNTTAMQDWADALTTGTPFDPFPEYTSGADTPVGLLTRKEYVIDDEITFNRGDISIFSPNGSRIVQSSTTANTFVFADDDPDNNKINSINLSGFRIYATVDKTAGSALRIVRGQYVYIDVHCIGHFKDLDIEGGYDIEIVRSRFAGEYDLDAEVNSEVISIQPYEFSGGGEEQPQVIEFTGVQMRSFPVQTGTETSIHVGSADVLTFNAGYFGRSDSEHILLKPKNADSKITAVRFIGTYADTGGSIGDTPVSIKMESNGGGGNALINRIAINSCWMHAITTALDMSGAEIEEITVEGSSLFNINGVAIKSSNTSNLRLYCKNNSFEDAGGSNNATVGGLDIDDADRVSIIGNDFESDDANYVAIKTSGTINTLRIAANTYEGAGTLLSQGASVTNLLSDIPISFTPTVFELDDVSNSYSDQYGEYTVVGELVTFQLRITFTPTFSSASGGMTILTSLPNNAQGELASLHVSRWDTIAFSSGYTQLVAGMNAANNTIQLYECGGGKNSQTISFATNLGSGTSYTIRVAGSYYRS